MFQVIGVDIGYGFVKITDGIKGYSFPSVIGDGNVDPTYSIEGNTVIPINDLKIKINGKLYFVGKYALRHSAYLHRDLSQSRAVENDLEILYLTALSLFCSDSTNSFKVVTGLPVDRMHMAGELKERIGGEKSVAVGRNNEFYGQRIIIDDLVIVPQPLGTYWSEYLDSFGRISDGVDGRVGIIDIGFKTTDLSVLEDGEYVASKSKSTFTGLSNAYRNISTKIASLYGIERESYALDEVVIKRKIRVRGESVDISDLVNEEFKKLAVNTLAEVNSIWNIAEFDALILSGGGGQSLSPFMLPHLPHGRLAKNPLSSNCSGYYNWGVKLWK